MLGVLRLNAEKSPHLYTYTLGSRKRIQPSPRVRRRKVGETDRVGRYGTGVGRIEGVGRGEKRVGSLPSSYRESLGSGRSRLGRKNWSTKTGQAMPGGAPTAAAVLLVDNKQALAQRGGASSWVDWKGRPGSGEESSVGT